MLRILILIGLGGGLGSIFRYLTAFVIHKYFDNIFPLATLVANVTGCLIIGILLGLIDRDYLVNNDLKYLFITGFCGGYTTFSTFMADNLDLIGSGNSLIVLLNIGLSLFLGLTATWVGLYLVR